MKQMFDTKKSKIKLVVYSLKNNSREVFFSLFNEECKGDRHVLEKMKERLLERKFNNNYQTAIFYLNNTDSILQKYVKGDIVLDMAQ